MFDETHSGPPERTPVSRGLNIQFANSSPVLLSPRPDSEEGFASQPRAVKTHESSKMRKPQSSPLVSQVIDDLTQIQRELALLARTENMHLSSEDDIAWTSTLLSSMNGRASIDGLDFSADENETLYDYDNTASSGLSGGRRRSSSSDYDLRSMVVDRLVELREKRTARRSSASLLSKATSLSLSAASAAASSASPPLSDEIHEISTAVRDILRDFIILFRLLAKKRFVVLLAGLSILVVFLARMPGNNSTTSPAVASAPAENSLMVAASMTDLHK